MSENTHKHDNASIQEQTSELVGIWNRILTEIQIPQDGAAQVAEHILLLKRHISRAVEHAKLYQKTNLEADTIRNEVSGLRDAKQKLLQEFEQLRCQMRDTFFHELTAHQAKNQTAAQNANAYQSVKACAEITQNELEESRTIEDAAFRADIKVDIKAAVQESVTEAMGAIKADLKQDYHDSKEDLQRSLSEYIDALKESITSDISASNEQHLAELKIVQADHKQEIQSCVKDILDTNKREMTQVNAQFQDELNIAQADHKQQIRSCVKDILDTTEIKITQANAKFLNELKAEQANHIQELKTSLKEILDANNKDFRQTSSTSLRAATTLPTPLSNTWTPAPPRSLAEAPDALGDTPSLSAGRQRHSWVRDLQQLSSVVRSSALSRPNMQTSQPLQSILQNRSSRAMSSNETNEDVTANQAELAPHPGRSVLFIEPQVREQQSQRPEDVQHQEELRIARAGKRKREASTSQEHAEDEEDPRDRRRRSALWAHLLDSDAEPMASQLMRSHNVRERTSSPRDASNHSHENIDEDYQVVGSDMDDQQAGEDLNNSQPIIGDEEMEDDDAEDQEGPQGPQDEVLNQILQILPQIRYYDGQDRSPYPPISQLPATIQDAVIDMLRHIRDPPEQWLRKFNSLARGGSATSCLRRRLSNAANYKVTGSLQYACADCRAKNQFCAQKSKGSAHWVLRPVESAGSTAVTEMAHWVER